MKRNEECKIIRDLLPSCVDKVTDEVTNKFIQNHIQDCEECKKILEDMGEEVILDKVKEKQKLDYLKKVRRKQGIKITLVTIMLLAMIGLAVLFCMFMVKGYLITDEEGNVQYVKSFISWVGLELTGNDIFSTSYNIRAKERTHISYVITILEGINGEKWTQIYTFDKEKDICLGMRAIYESSDTEEIKRRYEQYKEYERDAAERCHPSWSDMLDVEIKDGKLIYSTNYNGMPTETVWKYINACIRSGHKLIEI